jgi:hypothetical protein
LCDFIKASFQHKPNCHFLKEVLFINLFPFFVILGIEHRALHILGKCSATLAMPLALFIFETGSHTTFAQVSLEPPSPLASASHVAGIIGMYHHMPSFFKEQLF